MKCANCKDDFTIKSTEEYVSIKCKCMMIIIYPDGFVTKKNKKDYNPEHKK